VERFDWDGRRAYVRKIDCDYYTEAEAEVEVRTVAEDAREEFSEFAALRGSVVVTTQVPMFKKIRYYTGENVGAGEIRLPAERMGTGACWIDVGPGLASEMRIMEGGRSQALRGVAALLRAVAPVFLRCDRGDLRVHAEARSAATDLPRIVAYDRVPGGVGLAEGVHASLRSIVRAMRDIVEACRCPKGCPGCVGPAGDVGAYGKDVARHLLAGLVRSIDATPERVPVDLAPPMTTGATV
jgi:DEAD/DEAH box helicase domain-containing protein